MGTSAPDFSGIKAIFFDFMGTCLDWHTSIVASLPPRIPQSTRSALAIALRESFFSDIHARFEAHLPPEPIDETHVRLLAALLTSPPFKDTVTLTTAEQTTVVQAWHAMSAWPDVAPALSALHAKGYELFVLANGTTRLQLDLVRSSGLESFDMLFSSQLLNLTKPDPELYRAALRLVGVVDGDDEPEPARALMVAAHAYDLRAARKVGMRTAYVRRWTEDTREDMVAVRRDVDCFLGRVGAAGPDSDGDDGSLEGLVALL